MIISASYFKGSIQIDNVQDTAPNSNLLGNGSMIEDFISEYEPEILIQCLGFALYKQLKENLDETAENGLKADAVQKWDDLLNGKEYQIDGVPVKWDGLRFQEGTLRRSLIAYYVFYKFLENEKANTNVIEVKNSKAASAIPKAVKAWRKFHSLTVGNYNNPTIIEKSSGFGLDWLTSSNGRRSLYQFINDMNNIDPTTFKNWNGTHFENLNTFNI